MLGEEDAALFAAYYDVSGAGNFEGHNILNRLSHEPGDKTTEQRLASLRAALLAAREARVRPGLDDKVLADWNGLMIAALVNAGILLDEPGWLDMAARAFDVIARDMTRGDRLGHSWRAGKFKFPGLSSDFAAMIRAALALYEATGEQHISRSGACLAARARSRLCQCGTGADFPPRPMPKAWWFARSPPATTPCRTTTGWRRRTLSGWRC